MTRNQDYEVARAMIEREFDEASYSLKMVLESMGWEIPSQEILKKAQEHFRHNADFTREDVDDLAEIVNGKDIMDATSDNACTDYVVNFVAEKISASLEYAKTH